MGGHHGWSVRRSVRGGAAGAALAACCAAPLTAHAYPLQASITGFVKNNPGVTGVAGNYIRTSDVRYINSVAVTEARVITAGRTLTLPAAIRAAPTAARVVAAACFANPIACAGVTAGGVALALWLKSSDIDYDEGHQGFQIKETRPYTGLMWTNSVTPQWYLDPTGAAQAYVDWGNAVVPGYTHSLVSLTCVSETRCNYDVRRVPPQHTGEQPIVYTLSVDGVQRTGEVVEVRPATEADFEKHADDRPIHVGLNPDNQIGWSPDAVLDASPVPVPVDAPVFSPIDVPLGEPYPGPDPSTGPWKDDRLKLRGKPETTDPLDVEAEPVTRDVDNPNTEENEGPVEGPDGEPPVVVDKPQEDPCKLHPESVMCTNLGDAPGDQVPRREVSVDYAAETVGLPVGCPAPVGMGRFGQLSFDGACDAALTAKPFVIAFAALAAAMLMLAAIRRQ